MFRLSFLLSFLMVSTVFAAPPTDYSTDMVMLEGGEVMQTLHLYVSGEKSRLEGMTAGPMGPIITISRKDKGLVWTLFVNKKEYTEKILASGAATRKTDLSNFDLAKAEKDILGKENVMGYACTKMRVKMGTLPNGKPLSGTVWVADELEMPVRLETMGMIQENRNLVPGAQLAALFEVPPGFIKTDAPGKTPGMTPPNPPTAKSQKAKMAKPAGHKPMAVTGPLPPVPSVVGGSAEKPGQGLSLEAEALEILRCTSGEATASRFADDGYAMPGAFTGDQVLHWRNAEEVGAMLELNLAAPRKGIYGIKAHLGEYRTFGAFQFMVNNKPVGAPVDFFGFPEKDEVVPFSADLGDVNLNEGDNVLGLKLVGSNPDTVMPDHGACIDWLELTFRGGDGNGDTSGVVIPIEDETAGTVPTVPTAPTVPPVIGGSDEDPGQPATLEADTLEVLRCTSGEVITRKLAEDGYAEEGAFTGDLSLQWHDADAPGAVLELAFPVEKKGQYRVSVQVAMYRSYGIHEFLINGKPLGQPVDMFGNPGHDIVTPFVVELGEAELEAGMNRLGIRLAGTHPETIMANHGAGLDWICITPAGGKQ